MSTDNPEHPTARLDQLVPLNRLSVAARAVLLEDSHRLSFDENGLVQAKGERGDMLDYLLAGRVELVASETLRRVIDASDDEAQHPLDAGNPKSYTVVAMSRAVILRVPRSGLQQLLQFSDDEPVPPAGVSSALASPGESAVLAAVAGTGDWMERMLEPEFFARLPVENLQQVFQRMQRIEVVAGQVIVRPGQRGDGFYVVASGTATLSQSNESERVARIAELGPGESFGEDLLIADNPCGVRVTMRTDGVLMRIEREDFMSLVWDALVDRLALDGAAALVAQGAVWLDVRPARRFRQGSLPGSRHIPLTDLRAAQQELEKGPHYVVVCDDLARCGLAAFILARRGHVVSYVTEVPDFDSSRFSESVTPGATTATSAEQVHDAGGTGLAEEPKMQANATSELPAEAVNDDVAAEDLRTDAVSGDGGDTITQAQLSDLVASVDADVNSGIDEEMESLDDSEEGPGTQNDSLGDTIIGRSLADLLDEMDEFGRNIGPNDGGATEEADAIDTASLLGDESNLRSQLETGAAVAAAAAASSTSVSSANSGVDASIPVPTIRADQVDMQTLLHAMQRQLTVFLAAERSRIRADMEDELERRVSARTDRLKMIAREQVREKFSRLQDSYRSRQGEREEALRRSYEKLMRLARQVRSQKVEIQQTKRELEEKLGAASALHRQVDEIRGLLSTRIEKLQVLDDENDGGNKAAAEG